MSAVGSMIQLYNLTVSSVKQIEHERMEVEF